MRQMTNKLKVLSFLLVLFAGILTTTKVWAAETVSGSCGNVSWVLDTGGVMTFSGTGEMDMSGVFLDTSWEMYKDDIVSIVIGDGVTNIAGYAFYSCTNLTSVTIPDSVASIEGSAFSNCTSLTSVDLGNSVTDIGAQAFVFCTSLTKVTLPSTVENIGPDAFYGCSALADVYYGGSESDWSGISIETDNEPLTEATIHYNNGVTAAAAEAVQNGWSLDGIGWRYCYSNGVYATNTWMQDTDGCWYYFDETGYMATGWIEYNGNWYYCDANGNPSGAMVTGSKVIDGVTYSFDESGAWIQ